MKSVVIPILAALWLVCCMPACNSTYHLGYTPSIERDFYLPMDEMAYFFFDVDRYREKTFPFFAFHEMPPLTELKYGNNFGQPLTNELSWWNACPFFLIPPLCPCRELAWERGNYRVEAVVTYPAIYGFEPHIWYWEMTEIHPDRPAPPDMEVDLTTTTGSKAEELKKPPAAPGRAEGPSEEAAPEEGAPEPGAVGPGEEEPPVEEEQIEEPPPVPEEPVEEPDEEPTAG